MLNLYLRIWLCLDWDSLFLLQAEFPNNFIEVEQQSLLNNLRLGKIINFIFDNASSINKNMVTSMKTLSSALKSLTLISLGFAFFSNSAEATVLGYYQFNNSNNLGVDSSGLGNNLVAVGSGVTYTNNGQTGGGLNLTGAGNLSTTNGLVPIQFPLGNSSYTLQVSFQTTNTGALGLIGWGNYGVGNEVNALRLAPYGFSHYWWGNDLNASATTSDGAWHTVLASFDGITRDLWFDGALIAQNFPSGHNSGNANFAIGRTFGSEYFIGKLDNVAIFDTALTPSQAAATLAATVPEPGLIALMSIGLAGFKFSRKKITGIHFIRKFA